MIFFSLTMYIHSTAREFRNIKTRKKRYVFTPQICLIVGTKSYATNARILQSILAARRYVSAVY